MPDQPTTLSGHTEGPWEVRRRFDIYGCGGTYIGTTRGNRQLPTSVEMVDEANTRLIAAAPSLLAIATELYSIAIEAGLKGIWLQTIWTQHGIAPPASASGAVGRDGE